MTLLFKSHTMTKALAGIGVREPVPSSKLATSSMHSVPVSLESIGFSAEKVLKAIFEVTGNTS